MLSCSSRIEIIECKKFEQSRRSVFMQPSSMGAVKNRMRLKHVVATSIMLWCLINTNTAFEPISSTVAVGTAVLSALGFAGYHGFIKCRLNECCDKKWIRQTINGTELNAIFNKQIYGQHLATSSILKHLKGHLVNENPSKALALSLHGWTGTGKNFISQIIASYVYKQGADSSFVHLINAAKDFPHNMEPYIQKYKDDLKNMVESRISRCDRSMFIFDEIDKMPPGLIDVIKPYLEYYNKLDGVTYRKAMFFFLSNAGGGAINEFTLNHFKSGKERESIQLKDLEVTISKFALNTDTKSGLWHSEVITKNLVTAYIPFLPLEKDHVRNCTRDMMLARNYTTKQITNHMTEIVDQLTYYPDDIQRFSTTGCKRVAEKIDFIMYDES